MEPLSPANSRKAGVTKGTPTKDDEALPWPISLPCRQLQLPCRMLQRSETLRER